MIALGPSKCYSPVSASAPRHLILANPWCETGAPQALVLEGPLPSTRMEGSYAARRHSGPAREYAAGAARGLATWGAAPAGGAHRGYGRRGSDALHGPAAL